MEARYCPMCKSSAPSARLPCHYRYGGIATKLCAHRHAIDFLARPSAWSWLMALFPVYRAAHVWTQSCAGRASSLCIRTHGDELVKQCLDSLEHGPDHDLPDVPEARTGRSGCRRD